MRLGGRSAAAGRPCAAPPSAGTALAPHAPGAPPLQCSVCVRTSVHAGRATRAADSTLSGARLHMVIPEQQPLLFSHTFGCAPYARPTCHKHTRASSVSTQDEEADVGDQPHVTRRCNTAGLEHCIRRAQSGIWHTSSSVFFLPGPLLL